jgi:hypothetical protein
MTKINIIIKSATHLLIIIFPTPIQINYSLELNKFIILEMMRPGSAEFASPVYNVLQQVRALDRESHPGTSGGKKLLLKKKWP